MVNFQHHAHPIFFQSAYRMYDSFDSGTQLTFPAILNDDVIVIKYPRHFDPFKDLCEKKKLVQACLVCERDCEGVQL